MNLKKLLKYTIPALVIGFLAFGVAYADNPNFWLLNNNYIKLLSSNWNLRVNNAAADPTGALGGIYYNTGSNTFRCYTGSWANCAGSSGGSGGLGTTTPFTVGFIPEATSSPLVLSNSNIFQDASGNIGIGNINPTGVNANAKLTVAGISSQDIIASTTDNTTLSDAILQAYAPQSRVFLGAHGGQQVASRYGITLGGWGELGAFNNGSTTNGMIIGVQPNAPIVFGTNNLERMRINGNGSVSIGTTTSWSTLGVQTIATSSSSFYGLDIASSSGTSMLMVASSGNVGIGTTTPGQPLVVVGSTTITSLTAGCVNSTSSGALFVNTCNTGTVTGTGANGENAYWNSASSLGASADVFDNGTVSGINATSSTVNFNIQGTGTNNAFAVASSSALTLFRILGNNGSQFGMIASSTNSSTTLTGLPVLLFGTSALTAPDAGGVVIGSNAPPGFTGNFLQFQTNGTNEIRMSGLGNITANGLITGGTVTSTGLLTAGSISVGGNITYTAGNSLNAASTAGVSISGNLTTTVGNDLTVSGTSNALSGTNNGVRVNTFWNTGSGTGAANLLVVNGGVTQTGPQTGTTTGINISPSAITANNYVSLMIDDKKIIISTGTPASNYYSALFYPLTYETTSTTKYSITNGVNLEVVGAPIASTTSLSLTNSIGINIEGNALNASTTNGIGLQVAAPTGAKNNYAAFFNGGNVGIGTTTPLALLTLQGSSGSTSDLFDIASSTGVNIFQVLNSTQSILSIGTTSTASNLIVQGNSSFPTEPLFSLASSTGTSLMTVLANGNVGIGSSTPNYGFVANGTVAMPNLTASAGLQTGVVCVGTGGQLINDSVACLASARRYKKDISNLTVGLDETLKLQPVQFKWKDNFNKGFENDPNKNGIQYSLIADDVQKVDPHLATVEKNGLVHGLADLNHWIALFVQSFKDMEQQIVGIIFRQNALEAKVQQQQIQLDKQQQQIELLLKLGSK